MLEISDDFEVKPSTSKCYGRCEMTNGDEITKKTRKRPDLNAKVQIKSRKTGSTFSTTENKAKYQKSPEIENYGLCLSKSAEKCQIKTTNIE